MGSADPRDLRGRVARHLVSVRLGYSAISTTAAGAENTGTIRCLLVAALGGDPSLTRFAPAHFRPIPATDSDLKSATHLRNDV
jgi:hypothetical protein